MTGLSANFVVNLILTVAALSTIIAVVLAFHFGKSRTPPDPNDPFAIAQSRARRTLAKAILPILVLVLILYFIDQLESFPQLMSFGLLFAGIAVIVYWVRPKH